MPTRYVVASDRQQAIELLLCNPNVAFSSQDAAVRFLARQKKVFPVEFVNLCACKVFRVYLEACDADFPS